MSRRTRKRMLLFPLVLILLAATATLAPSASAAGTVVGTLSPSSVPGGSTRTTMFTLTPSNGQVGSFNLTAPAGWALSSLSAPAGVTLVGSQIQGRSLSVSSSSPLSITFSSQAPCAAASSNWTLVARGGNNLNGSVFGNDPSSVLSTSLDSAHPCTAAFVAGPANAAFNGGTKSENITSQPYVPTGTAMQALVNDGDGFARSGITLTLQLSGGTSGAALTGPTSATSDAGGLATFTGSVGNPIAIDATGLNYALTPSAAGVTATASATFNIFQEGDPCVAGQSCVVHGNNNRIDATIAANGGGDLGGSVEPVTVVSLQCNEATPLSQAVIVWTYADGEGAQIVRALVDKSLLRKDKGSAHVEVCFEVDPGKPAFTDKFGATVTRGLLADCSPTISINCILSETASAGGGRLITFTVEDGKGRI